MPLLPSATKLLVRLGQFGLVLFGPAAATGQAKTCQREARAHDLDEGAAILAFERVGRNGEFAMRERHGLRVLLTLAE